MPQNVAKLIAESAREHYVVLGRTIYAVQRIDSDKLRHHGWAELEGAASVKQAINEIERQEAELRALIDPKKKPSDEAQAKWAALQRSRLMALVARPEGETAFLARCTAYICAAVVGAGRLREDVDLGGPALLLPGDAEPATLAVDLRTEDEIARDERPVYLAPTHFVQRREDEDVDSAIVWVHRLSDVQRTTLGTMVIGLQSVAGEVTPFRRAAGAARDVSSAGEGVREVAARGAGADPVADGVHPAVPTGRSARGAANRERARTRDPGRADRVR